MFVSFVLFYFVWGWGVLHNVDGDQMDLPSVGWRNLSVFLLINMSYAMVNVKPSRKSNVGRFLQNGMERLYLVAVTESTCMW